MAEDVKTTATEYEDEPEVITLEFDDGVEIEADIMGILFVVEFILRKRQQRKHQL